MAIIPQLLPALSPTMEDGTLVAWHIKEGDKVESGQVMAEVQTDKAVGEWECLDGGTCRKILIPEGEHAVVNMVAAIFTTKDEDIADAVKEAEETNARLAGGGAEGGQQETGSAASEEAGKDQMTGGQQAAAQPASAPAAAPAPAPAPKPAAAAPAPAAKPGKVRVSPVAARIAAANGIDINKVRGTGDSGRVVKTDVEQAIASGSAKMSGGGGSGGNVPNPFLGGDRPAVTDVAMSQMRSVIGKRLLESKTQIPHFYATEVIDVSALVTMRKQLNEIEGVKVSFNDLVTKATALNLRRFPRVNSTFDGTTIREHAAVDISIAVAIPEGLITPILFAAHELTVSQISAGVKALAQKAMAGKLQPEEFQGGTFTISNLGMYGIEEFNAIINPPQCAILAVGGIKDEPVVKNGEVVPGKTMRVTLSADHRVVDGADGAAFLKGLRELLESPASLML